MSYETALLTALAAGIAFFALNRIAPRCFRTGEDLKRILVYSLIAAAVVAAVFLA